MKPGLPSGVMLVPHPLARGRRGAPRTTGMFGCYKGVLHSQGMASSKMHFRYMHHLVQLDSEIHDKVPISQTTNTVQEWLKEPRT